MLLKLLKKHIDALCNIYNRSQWMIFLFFYLVASSFANVGAKVGLYSFSAWILALILIYTIFKNAIEMAELGY